MRHHNQKNNQDVEDTEEDFMSDEVFDRLLYEALKMHIENIKVESSDIEIPTPSKRYKIGMNRVFRERVGGDFLPFPEMDNFYERVRSKIVIKLKINEFFDRRKKRKRGKKG